MNRLRDLFPVSPDREKSFDAIERVLEAPALAIEPALALAEDDRFCRDAVEAWADAGGMEIFIPPSLGGTGDFPTIYRASAILAAHDLSIALAIGVVSLATLPLRIAGGPGPAARWFGRIREGSLAAIGLTEEARGTDLAANRTRAERVRLEGDRIVPVEEGDGSFTHYRVFGEKNLINNATEGGFVVTMVRTGAEPDPSTDATAHSVLVIDRSLPGVIDGPKRRTHGIRSVDISDVRFEGCLVPRDDRLGLESQGFRIVRRTLELSRGGVSAFAAGGLAGALALAEAHARTRRVYGRPIVEIGQVRDTLVRAGHDLEWIATHSAATARASWASPFGSRATTAVAKYLTPLVACAVVDSLGLILGAQGFQRRHPFERFRRDLWVLPIFDGTAHVQVVELTGELRRGLHGVRSVDAAEQVERIDTLWGEPGDEPDLMRGIAPLPATDAGTLQGLEGGWAGHGFAALAAARHAIDRRVRERAEISPETPTPRTVNGDDAEIVDLYSRFEATAALAFRVLAERDRPSETRRGALAYRLDRLAGRVR